MVYYMKSAELYHHGIKGMKWGVRREKDVVKKGRAKRVNVEQTGKASPAKVTFKRIIRKGAPIAAGVLAGAVATGALGVGARTLLKGTSVGYNGLVRTGVTVAAATLGSYGGYNIYKLLDRKLPND